MRSSRREPESGVRLTTERVSTSLSGVRMCSATFEQPQRDGAGQTGAYERRGDERLAARTAEDRPRRKGHSSDKRQTRHRDATGGGHQRW